jgi:hypothetical protein
MFLINLSLHFIFLRHLNLSWVDWIKVLAFLKLVRNEIIFNLRQTILGLIQQPSKTLVVHSFKIFEITFVTSPLFF